MGNELVNLLAAAQFPQPYRLVVAAGHGVFPVGQEGHTLNDSGVPVHLLLDPPALGVPQDGPHVATREEPTPVRRDGQAEDAAFVAHELAHLPAVLQVPHTDLRIDSVFPGTGPATGRVEEPSVR